MEAIGRLPRLRKLDLSHLPVGDAHVKALSPLKNLQFLNLRNTRITGKSLLPIAQHVQLEELYLGGEDLTDYSRRRGGPLVVTAIGLHRLASLTKLRTLQIRASGLGSFGGFDSLPQLESLDIRRGTERDLLDAEIAAIARLPKLRSLRLPHPPEVNQISLLRPLTRLRRLDPISGKHKDQLKAEIQRHLPRTDFGSSDVPALDDGTTVRFSKVPLHDMLRFLSRVHEIPIHLDESSLEEIGVSANEPIDAVLSGITLREVLHRMLSAHGLIAIPNHHGLTVTTQEGNCLYRDDYDLSELLRGVEAGDNLTVRLSQIIQRLVSPDVWGRDFPVLPHENTLHDGPGRILGDQPEKSLDVETATAEIVEAGTTLIVTASAKTHVAIRDIMNQLTRGEDSQLLSANFRQLVETPPKSPHLKNGNATINFSELPLIDGVEFLSRSYLHPIVIDTVGLEKAGIRPGHRLNAVFEYTTLEECLDTLLEPLKLTWIYQEDAIKIVTQKDATERPTIVVHQLFGDLIEPYNPEDDWRNMLKSICEMGTGKPEPHYEFWFGRLIVIEPWRNQLTLARQLRKFSHPRRAQQAARN